MVLGEVQQNKFNAFLNNEIKLNGKTLKETLLNDIKTELTNGMYSEFDFNLEFNEDIIINLALNNLLFQIKNNQTDPQIEPDIYKWSLIMIGEKESIALKYFDFLKLKEW